LKKHRWAILDEIDRQNEYMKKLREPFEMFQRQVELMQNAAGAAAQMMSINDHVRSFTESSALNSIKEMAYQREHWQHLVESPAVKTMEFLNKQIEYSRPIMYLQEEFQKQASYINSIGASSAFQAIASAFDKSNLAELMQQTFATDLFSKLDMVMNRIEVDAGEDALSSLEEIIEQKCKSLEPGNLNYQGMLNILGLILAIYSLIAGNQSEKNLITILMQSEQRILKNIDSLKPAESKEVYYVVERTVKLRLKPSTKSHVITILHPNQRVSLINSKGKWIYVEYFDYIEGLPKSGWACKKYLNRLGR